MVESVLWQLPESEVAAVVSARVVALHRAYADVLAAVGTFDQRDIAARFGYRDTAAWLGEELRLSRREAKTVVAHAHSATLGTMLGGQPRAADLAEVAVALGEGEISREHYDQIHRLFAVCPPTESAPDRAELQRVMVTAARQLRPEDLARVSARVLARWREDVEPADPSGELVSGNRVERRYDRHGRLRFSGRLDPEAAATLEGLFGALAAPRPEPDGSRDGRSTPEREGDALAEIIALAARVDDGAVQGGEQALMTVTVSLDQVREELRHTVLEVPGLGRRSPDEVRRLACEAAILPAMFAGDGQPLYLGRAQRLASRAQRRALAHRDLGCTFPGCSRGPRWCTPHHVRWWSRGGATDLDNLVLLCRVHHRMVHHTEWQVRLRGGSAEFLPPARMDPARQPIRNLAHTIGPPPPNTEPPRATENPWALARAG